MEDRTQYFLNHLGPLVQNMEATAHEIIHLFVSHFETVNKIDRDTARLIKNCIAERLLTESNLLLYRRTAAEISNDLNIDTLYIL